jgi:hypothetical protein
VYRFALYGRTAAGKTCFLAALNMTRRKHPRGYVCDRLPGLNGVASPPGNPETWDIRHDPVKAFYAGAHKIAEAEQVLASGGIPPPTRRQPPYLLVYSFTDPQHGKCLAELIDYAGELTDPDLVSDDPGKLADLLQRHIETLDGLFVLAEAPRKGEESTSFPEELRRLRQSLDLLHKRMARGTKWSIPVALILSKWDRQGQVDASNEERLVEVTAFLHSPGADEYSKLDSALRGITTDPERNYSIFAASAFGQTRSATVVLNDESRQAEVPVSPGLLASYGLEDPFFFAIRRRDAIDLDSYRKAIPSGRGSRWLNPLKPLAPLGWWSRARRLGHQLPKGSAEQQEVSQAAGWHLAACVTRTAVFMVLLGILLSFGEMLWDQSVYARMDAILADEKATAEDRRLAEDWLHNYGTSSLLRHLVSRFVLLGKTQAMQTWSERRSLVAQGERQRKINENEARLSQLEVSFQREDAAGLRDEMPFRAMLDAVNNLPFHPDAETEGLRKRRLELRRLVGDKLTQLAGNEQAERERQNLGFLTGIRNRLQNARSRIDLDGIVQDWKDGLPYPKTASAAVQTEQEKVRGLLSVRSQEIAKQGNWDQWTSRYNQAMKEEKLSSAAEHLVRNRQDTPEWRKLRDDCRTRGLDILASKVEKLQEDGSYTGAIKLLDDTLADANLAKVLDPADRQKVNQLITGVKVAHGRSIYDELRKSKTLKDTNNYLTSRVDQRMAVYVQKYQEYLEQMEQPRKWTIRLAKIDWGEWWEDYVNKVWVKIDDKNLIWLTDVKSTKGSSSDVGKGVVLRKLKVRIELQVWVWNSEGKAWFSTRPAGKKTYKGTLLNLHERWLDLERDEPGSPMGARVYFEVDGIPGEPELPAWKDKS